MSAEESSSDTSDAVGWYDDHAESIVERHESLAPERVNAWLEPLLPSQPALVLDVGAGSGRDAAWLVSLGHNVIAAEPSEQMRFRGQRLHASDQFGPHNKEKNGTAPRPSLPKRGEASG